MNTHRLGGVWLGSLLIVVFSLLLAGCQSVSAGGSSSSGGSVVVGTASLDFGTVANGSSKTVSDTLSNNTASSVTINSITGSSSDLQVLGISPPLVVGAGQSVPFSVQFKPTGTENLSRTLSLLGANSNVLVSLTVSGNSAPPGQLSLSPSPVAFGSINVGSNQTISVTLSNSGGTDITVNQATLSGAGFTIGNLALPLTLHASGTASLSVTFAPTGAGNFTGSVTFATSAGNVVLSISGTGVAVGQLTANPASLAFGSVQVGTNSSKSDTLTNTGGTALTISAATASGSGFSLSGLTLPVTLNAGQSTTFTVQFAPTVSGAASGSISITSNGTNPNLSIPLTGTGVTPATIAANPTTLSFGSVQVGNSSGKSETLTNTGGSPATLSQANVTGAAFSVSGLTLPTTLTSNQSVTFTVTFSPTSAGSASGTLTIVSNASNPSLNITLSGTGTAPGQLAVSPATLSFGNVTVGSSSSLNGALNATGASVTVSSYSITNSEFTLSGISLPTTIAAGSSAPFTVTFTPQSSGAASGSLSFVSNATNSPTVQTLTGTGVAASSHSVDLTWNSSTNAVGYNVYRGDQTGGPYSIINTSLDASTAYTDNNVALSHTYYYVVKAVDGSGTESGPSNEAQAIIPAS